MTKSQFNNSLADTLRGKLVVADTSSLLMAGTGLLGIIEDCTIVIPAVVVKELEEKRTHSTLGFLSREWIRLLEVLRTDFGNKLSKGVAVAGYKNVKVRVEPNHSAQTSLPRHLQDGSVDSTVLAVAKNFVDDKAEGGNVVLLSNDTPMRLHATLDIDVPAFEFSATQIVGAKPYDGRYSVTISDQDAADASDNGRADGRALSELHTKILKELPKGRSKNAFVTVKLESSSDSDKPAYSLLLSGNELTPVHHKSKAFKITGRTTEQDVAIQYLKAPANDVPIVSLGGSAGTGKTLITMAVALDELTKGNYQKVMVFRSLHEMGHGQEMGFLPGNVNDKMEAWAGAIFDSLDVLAAKAKPLKRNATDFDRSAQKEQAQKYRNMIEIAPITYLRGRSLANTFMVLEEAQNFSRSEILNILSRAGEGSKIILTFDAAQVDNKFLQAGKNADIWSVIESLKQEDLFAHITLQKTERSKVAEIASRILEGK